MTTSSVVIYIYHYNHACVQPQVFSPKLWKWWEIVLYFLDCTFFKVIFFKGLNDAILQYSFG